MKVKESHMFGFVPIGIPSDWLIDCRSIRRFVSFRFSLCTLRHVTLHATIDTPLFHILFNWRVTERSARSLGLNRGAMEEEEEEEEEEGIWRVGEWRRENIRSRVLRNGGSELTEGIGRDR